MFNQNSIKKMLVGKLWVNDLEETGGQQGEFCCPGSESSLSDLIDENEHGKPMVPVTDNEGNEVMCMTVGYQIAKARSAPTTGDERVDKAKFIVRIWGFHVYLYHGVQTPTGYFPGTFDLDKKEMSPYGLVGVYWLEGTVVRPVKVVLNVEGG